MGRSGKALSLISRQEKTPLGGETVASAVNWSYSCYEVYNRVKNSLYAQMCGP